MFLQEHGGALAYVRHHSQSILSALKQRRIGQLLVFVVAIGGSILVLGGLVYRERDALLTYEWQIQWEYLVISFGVFILGSILAGLTWGNIMRTLGSSVDFERHFRYYSFANAAKRLPGTLWYLAGRGYLYKQQGESLRLVTIATSLELLLSLIAGLLVSLVFAARTFFTVSHVHPVVLVGGTLLGLLLVHPATLRWILARLNVDVADVQNLPYLKILQWLVTYVVIWIAGGVVVYLVTQAITTGTITDAIYLIGSWAIVGVFSTLIFFLPSNFGILEVSLSLLLTNIMPSSIAVLIVILLRLLLLAYEIIGIGIYSGILLLHNVRGGN